jgi:hypothetical protein
MTIREQLDQKLDPTDSNVCSDVAYASINLLKYAARAVWAQNHHMSIGRDDARELGVALKDMGEALGLISSRPSGAESDAFFARLLAETGIVEPAQPGPPQAPAAPETM